ncbi:orotidine-5'-phosphate decarboxylase [Streptomyces avidinii]|uniref:Orotidine 5'-phosphate decarboxylase n=1 Tax=Streptomyces avidinii TaxID=1895 RepID=A0ABS4L874_STRAV|nr:orotidine-5'-phosphate decarboxylase [Streptomyces avidinii]MBP2038265.1 orotidine-5'-phosphate decarboxylase [Streptomyces avidinii]GGZ14132.1 orotidine 5'-phosphate decarboxylase [Streptomyces avidinii]
MNTDPAPAPAIAVTPAVDPAVADRRVIVALDFDDRRAAETLVERLGDACGSYKIGLELLVSAGPGLVRDLVERGHEVFLDLKLFEIPNSVAGAVRAAGALGASMVTVHAMGGTGIMSAAVEAAREFPRLRVLALTVVTSMTGSDLADIGVDAGTEEQVLRLARLAVGAGCDGVVASPREAGVLRELLGPDRLVVTPGVTLGPEAEDGAQDDEAAEGRAGVKGRRGAVGFGGTAGGHARPGTPRAAFAAGASHVVVGRSVSRAADPLAALRRVVRAAG